MTLSKKYEEIYGKNANFSNEVNKNVLNQRNNYTNNDFNDSTNNYLTKNKSTNKYSMNNYPENSNTNYPTEPSYELPVLETEPSSWMFYTFLLFVLACVVGSIIYFKDNLIDYYNRFIKPNPNINNELKQLNKSIKKEKKIREKKEKEKETNKKKETGGIRQLSNQINYKSNQIAKDDGYCYIGYDKDMRSCGEIYEGQVCMSGEIFPSLEMCMFPRLRE
jgi:hypothetical protein